MLPMRREKHVLVQELPEETLVYDVERNKAHWLNRSAALVWRHCDGRTTVPEMAKVLHNELSIPAEEQLVWHTLARLQSAHLLSESITPPAKLSRMSRRDWVRKLGVAAVVVPAVMTVIAPTVAMAASQTCGTPPNCNGPCPSGKHCAPKDHKCQCIGGPPR
jgi:hypothetical protein